MGPAGANVMGPAVLGTARILRMGLVLAPSVCPGGNPRGVNRREQCGKRVGVRGTVGTWPALWEQTGVRQAAGKNWNISGGITDILQCLGNAGSRGSVSFSVLPPVVCTRKCHCLTGEQIPASPG